MATLRTRRRPQILLQLDEDFHPAWILSLTDERLLVDAGVELAPGTSVHVHLPRPDGDSVDLVAARSVHCCQDVLAPASSEYRFLIVLGIDGDLGPTGWAALKAASEQPAGPSPWSWRRRPPTHDAELVQATLGMTAAD